MTDYADALHAAGIMVAAEMLTPAGTASTVIEDGPFAAVKEALAGVFVIPRESLRHFTADTRSGGIEFTDGPYARGERYIGGFTIVDVADDERARYWAGRIAEACGWLRRWSGADRACSRIAAVRFREGALRPDHGPRRPPMRPMTRFPAPRPVAWPPPRYQRRSGSPLSAEIIDGVSARFGDGAAAPPNEGPPRRSGWVPAGQGGFPPAPPLRPCGQTGDFAGSPPRSRRVLAEGVPPTALATLPQRGDVEDLGSLGPGGDGVGPVGQQHRILPHAKQPRL